MAGDTGTETVGAAGGVPPRPRILGAVRDGRIGRGVALAALLAGFMLALSQVEDLVREREAMRGDAEAAVGALWAPAQLVSGPFLVVPEDRVSGSGADLRAETVHHVVTPREVHVDVALATETRRRGLFEVPVYTADVTVTGRFEAADMEPLLRSAGLSPPILALTLTDAGGIAGTPEASWAGAPATVIPDLPPSIGRLLGGQAVGARLALPGGDGRFRIAFQLRGTERLLLAPAAGSTTVAMRSAWPHPSFVGSRTAETHRITGDGFEAAWRLGPFGRSVPSGWIAGPSSQPDAVAAIAAQAFGVALVQPVDPYRMTERTLKYGMLFALYTFGAFLILEVVFGRPLHWLHYALTGASVATFFLLLLSLSEVVGFAAAYALGAASVVLQTGLYAGSVLGNRRLALGFAGLLAVLYGGLFGLLRLEDTALVTGSIGLFAAIGLAMALTRRLGLRPA